MKHPLEMLVRLLVNGGRVSLDGNEYAMGEDGSICTVMRNEENVELGFKVDCDVSALYKMAEDIGGEELWLRLCELQLNNINNRKNRHETASN